MDDLDFGSRMKFYEGFETERCLMPLLPVLARMDGVNFHEYTRDMDRPFDANLSSLMIDLSTWLIEEFHALVAYTQSDEITLGWNQEEFREQLKYGGRIQKLNSVLAAKTSVAFNRLRPNYLPKKGDAYFDARVWNVPNEVEAANVFLWREQDATRNSVQMAGRAYFSHGEMMHKNNSEVQEMLFSKKGINWNNYESRFKRGTFILRRKALSKFENIEELPKNHAARKNPDLMIERTKYIKYDMPPFGKVTNRDGVLFFGEEPKTNSNSDA
jgi:tRNA(His) guanylyltransferase